MALQISRTTAPTPQDARNALLRKFRSKLSPDDELNRQSVSFQGNREAPLYSWFRYKEGFSAEMVTSIIRRVSGKGTGVLLDPFAGAGTALFAAQSLGWVSRGIEILPIGLAICEARYQAGRVNLSRLRRAFNEVKSLDWQQFYEPQFRFRHIPITEKAFPESAERCLAGFRAYCEKRLSDAAVRQLLLFACMCILESVSFTRKDGQYLRWDKRAGKGRVSTFDKGRLPEFPSALISKLEAIYRDIERSRHSLFPELEPRGSIDYRLGSSLAILPTLDAESIDLIFTSPPYCNRYDYTRTYALELVFLGCTGEQIKELRQAMLSCTVENREKIRYLQRLYADLRRPDQFVRIERVFRRQHALHEVLSILNRYRAEGRLNNSNVPKMVRNYFYEMCFIIHELYRILRPGGKVVMVNDNVRYAGEEVPVDIILSNIAEGFGLTTDRIWTLQRGKGNSSQQMGNHGRTELRKCVYVWEK